MGSSRFAVVMAAVAALVIGFILGSVVTPSSAAQSAAQFSEICPLADRAGKPLTGQDVTLKGDTRCLYGEAHDPRYPCEDSPVSNAMLLRIGSNDNGQTRCVYREYAIRPTLTPKTPVVSFRGMDAYQPPESTREATP